MKISKLFNMS